MRVASGELFPRFRENYDSIGKRSWRPPLAVSDTAASDLDNWITYPACYPHLVRYLGEDGSYFFAVRMRNVVGWFKVFGDPSTDATEAARQLELLWFELGLSLEFMREREDEDVYERYAAYCDDLLGVEFEALSKAADPLWPSPLAPFDLETDEHQFCGTVPHWLPVLRRVVKPSGAVGFTGFLPRPWPIMFIPEIAKATPSEGIAVLQEALAEMSFARAIYREEIVKDARDYYSGFCRRRGFTEPRPTYGETVIPPSGAPATAHPGLRG